MPTLAAGSNTQVSLAAGVALYVSGSGTLQVAPPNPGPLVQIQQAGTSVGPFLVPVTVNLSAATTVTYRTDDNSNPMDVSAVLGPDSATPIGLNLGGVTYPIPKQTTGNNVAILGNSICAQVYPTWASTDAGWLTANSYSLSAFASPSVYDLTGGYIPLRYQVTTAGVSGATEPIWPTVAGGTVTDGTVVWTAVANSATPFWQQSWWHIAQSLSGQRLNEVFIAGRSGKQSADILLYVDRALASGADIIYFATMFENDCWPGAAPSLATVTASWTAVAAAMDRCRNLGKRVMTQTVLPNGNIDASSLFTGYSRGNGTKAWQWLNAQIRDFVRSRPDVIFFDAASVYVDTNPANPVWPENTLTYLSQSGSGQALKKTDGVHPQGAAGYALGAALAPVLSANFAAVSHFGTALDENARSKNPLNGGTGGTAGTNMSGTIAASMGTNAYGTATGVGSLVARTDIAGNWQQIVYSATVADNVDYNTLTAFPLNNFAVGDLAQGFAELKVLANPTLLKQIYLRMDYSGGSPSQSLSGTDIGNNAQDVGQFMTTDTTWTVKTVPMKIPTGTTGFVLFCRQYGRGAASYTSQFGRQSVMRLPNPALA